MTKKKITIEVNTSQLQYLLGLMYKDIKALEKKGWPVPPEVDELHTNLMKKC